MTAPVVDQADVAVDLVRWAIGTEHRKPKDRAYPLTEEGDYAAWLDRLSGQMTQDRAEVARVVRRETDWKPRPDRFPGREPHAA